MGWGLEGLGDWWMVCTHPFASPGKESWSVLCPFVSSTQELIARSPSCMHSSMHDPFFIPLLPIPYSYVARGLQAEEA